MQNMNKTLIALVGPSASGKTTILSQLTKEGYKSIVSTTDRNSRPGEVNGIDYYFLDTYRSKEIEQQQGFVETVVYNSVRYGVTLEEFDSKMESGLAFIILEPNGLDNYRKFCENRGVKLITMFVKTLSSIRYQRLKEQANAKYFEDNSPHLFTESGVDRIIRSAVFENDWEDKHNWNFILDGNVSPEQSVNRIKNIIKELK